MHTASAFSLVLKALTGLTFGPQGSAKAQFEPSELTVSWRQQLRNKRSIHLKAKTIKWNKPGRKKSNHLNWTRAQFEPVFYPENPRKIQVPQSLFPMSCSFLQTVRPVFLSSLFFHSYHSTETITKSALSYIYYHSHFYFCTEWLSSWSSHPLSHTGSEF